MSEHSLGPLFPVAVSGVLHFRRIHQCLSLLGSDGTLSFLLHTKDLAGAIITTLWVSAKGIYDIKEPFPRGLIIDKGFFMFLAQSFRRNYTSIGTLVIGQFVS